MPENTTTTQVLAIRPGKREMGLAVLEGKDLVFWGVAGFRGHRQKLLETVERRVQRLVRTYQPELVVVEKPTKLRLAASWSLPSIVNRIRETVVQSGLQLRIYDQDTVRRELCGSAWATRHELAARIVERYPHLERYKNCSSEWKTSYWLAMFAAVAVGVVCATDVSSR